MSQADFDEKWFSDDLSECAKNGVPIRCDEDPSLHYTSDGRRLGKGGTGEVFRWTCKKTGNKFAIKQTPENPFSIHEMITWSAIGHHQNVVRLIEVFVWQNTIYAAAKNRRNRNFEYLKYIII